MDANEYQRLAAKTDGSRNDQHRIINAALGLAGESGEVAALVWARLAATPVIDATLDLIIATSVVADSTKKYYFQGHIEGFKTAVRDHVRAARAACDELEILMGQEIPSLSDEPMYRMPEIGKELGDVQWYIAQAATAVGTPLAVVMDVNIAKLRQRYPDGFDAERSQNREAV